MIVPDINLLIYAYNQADPYHEAARDWWEVCLNGTIPVGIPWIVIAGFIRIITHPKVLERPMPVASATERAREWLDQPIVVTIEPGRSFPQLFFNYLDQLGAAGNLTTDAVIAALAVERNAEVQSNDTDFSRFQGLRWRNPLS